LKKNIINEKELPYEKIIVLHAEDITDFTYQGAAKIVIIMPCIDLEMGRKTADIMLRRSRIGGCSIIIVMDNEKNGFIRTLNTVAEKCDTKFVCYVAQDAYPGKGWLKKAYVAIEENSAGLVGFNDGKWDGRIASFGMVRKEWIKKFYKNEILSSAYKSHKADNEITILARVDDSYVYCPESVLIECDYEKDSGGSNKEDNKVFSDRFNNFFPASFSKDIFEKYKKEYNVK